jgi:PAS domain S-box-containing protein
VTPPPKRVLVVEDQRLVAADLEDSLKRLGYDVVGSVASGEEANSIAIVVRPDLALMDIRLRGEMDGIQTASAIRERMDIPIIYLTAYADEETVRRAMVTGPFGYLVKPFNERELRAAIDIAIYKHGNDRLLAEERARRHAAEEFKFLVEGVEDYAIFLLDLAGRVSTWNVGAERIKGYAPKEVIGRHFSVFYTPEDVQAAKPEAELRAAIEKGHSEDEGWRIRKDGSRFWANVIINTLRDEQGQVRGFAKVTRDMTAQKLAEAERKHQEASGRLLDQATVALASSLDISETIQKAARLAIPDLADWCLVDFASESDELGQVGAAHVDPGKEELARRLGREIIPRVQHGAHQVFKTGQPELHSNLDDLARAGELLGTRCAEPLRHLGVASYVCVPIHLRGRVQGVLNLLRADPARRYTLHDLAVAQELARRIGLAVDNARLFRDAQEAIRARDEFLQIASHELKTPLTPLQMQLDMLTRAFEKSGIQNERLSAKLDAATRQTARLGRLVESLLDVSRITAGRFHLDLEGCDLSGLVREVADRFHGEAKKAGSELKVSADDTVVGRWDRLRLDQIISNLVSNAIKYGLGKPIEIDVREMDDTVRVAVTDHGIGIEKEALGRIFGRFERGVSLRHYGGLGLGLFIARQFAEAHGGTIVAQSQPGAGSTFTLVLRHPRRGEHRAAAQRTDQVER